MADEAYLEALADMGKPDDEPEAKSPSLSPSDGPPPPTGKGAMPTGNAKPPRETASAIVMMLADLKAAFPSAADRIDGMIAEVTALAKGPAVGAAPGTPGIGMSLPPPPIMPMGGPGALGGAPPAPPGGPPLPLPPLG